VARHSSTRYVAGVHSCGRLTLIWKKLEKAGTCGLCLCSNYSLISAKEWPEMPVLICRDRGAFRSLCCSNSEGLDAPGEELAIRRCY